jgi:hypothetical protein
MKKTALINIGMEYDLTALLMLDSLRPMFGEELPAQSDEEFTERLERQVREDISGYVQSNALASWAEVIWVEQSTIKEEV